MMNRYLNTLVISIVIWYSTALAQDHDQLGSLLPVLPQSYSQIASRFMFEVRNAQWAADTEGRISDAIGRFNGDSATSHVSCKATICRATVQVLNPDSSVIWNIDAKSADQPFGPLPYHALAELAGFERVTERSRSSGDDGSGTVYLFFSNAEYRPGFF